MKQKFVSYFKEKMAGLCQFYTNDNYYIWHDVSSDGIK
mgnify:CR=1 FL=1